MSRELARRAGSAVVWRSAALAGEKLIFLVRLIILARILAPSDFGLVAIGMAAMILMVTLTDLGVVSALVQNPARDKNHLDTAWTLSVVRGVLVALVLFFAAPLIAGAFGEPAAKPFVQAMAVTFMLRATASIGIAQLNRELHFRSLAFMGLATALVNTVVAVSLANSLGPWSLVWGSIAGAVTFLATSFVAAPYSPRFRLDLDAVRSIMRFGRWMFLIGIIAVLSDTVLRLIITRQLGVAELGLFFMAARLGFLPAQLISEIIGTVAFPVYAHLQDNREKAANIYRKLLLATSAMMIPACTVFLFLTPAIVTELLGERWQGTIVVLQFLIASTMVGVLVESIAPLMKGIGQPAKLVGMDSVQFLVLVGLGWVLVDRFGLTGAGLAWFGSILAQQFMAYFHARRLLGHPFRGVGRVFLAICLSAAVATAIAVRIVDAIAGIAGILVAVAGAIVSTLLIMAFLDQRSGLGLRQILAEPFPWAARFGKMRHVED